MAILHNQILGMVRGSARNLTFKLRKDVNYFSTKPSKKKLPMDRNSLFRREQFRFIGKLSKSIYQSPLLRIAWEKVKTDKTWCTYDDIFKANYKKIRYNDLGIPALFPGPGFKLRNPVVQKTEVGFEFSASGIGLMRRFNLLNTHSISLIGVFLYTNSESPAPPANLEVESVSTNVTFHDMLSPIRIYLKLTGDTMSHFKEGSIIKAYFTLAFLNKKEHPVSFSEIITL